MMPRKVVDCPRCYRGTIKRRLGDLWWQVRHSRCAWCRGTGRVFEDDAESGRTEKPLHQQHPELMCRVCGGAGSVYQDGYSIRCHLCRGRGITDVPRDGYGEPIEP